MGFGKELFESTISNSAGSAAGSIGSQLSYGLAELTGYNDAIAKRQLKQQEALTRMQYSANLALLKNSFAEQLNLWNATNAEAQVEHLKNAGLNPALMYAKGGQGGSTGGGSASVSGGNASGEAERMSADINRSMMGLAMMKAQSEIDVNKSIAEKNRAEAQTTTESRGVLIEKLKQDGKGQWLENVKQRMLMGEFTDDITTLKNKEYGEISITKGSLFTEQAAADIAQALASAENSKTQAILTNEKAKGYWQELLNDTARANAAGVQAAAVNLASEFNFGDLYNAKYWIQVAKGAVGDVLNFIKP